jgi:hypothetical protein
MLIKAFNFLFGPIFNAQKARINFSLNYLNRKRDYDRNYNRSEPIRDNYNRGGYDDYRRDSYRSDRGDYDNYRHGSHRSSRGGVVNTVR